MVLKIGYHYGEPGRRGEYHPYLTPFIKIKVYLEIDLNGNAETIKLLEEKNICKLGVGRLRTQDTKSTNQKRNQIDKVDLFTIKTFSILKVPLRIM